MPSTPKGVAIDNGLATKPCLGPLYLRGLPSSLEIGFGQRWKSKKKGGLGGLFVFLSNEGSKLIKE